MALFRMTRKNNILIHVFSFVRHDSCHYDDAFHHGCLLVGVALLVFYKHLLEQLFMSVHLFRGNEIRDVFIG